jgi:hypothetical protein
MAKVIFWIEVLSFKYEKQTGANDLDAIDLDVSIEYANNEY